VAGSAVTLAWQAPAGGAVTNYVIEAGSAPGGSNLANVSTTNSSTTFTATGVGAGTYYVRVRAAGAFGIGPPSNEVMVVVGSGCAPPAAPNNLAASVTGSTVTLSWSATAGATTYVLEAGSGPGQSDLLVIDLRSSAATLTATNVAARSYFVRVRAANACGASGASNEAVVVVR
jgi:predicted phage tail protein